MSKITPLIVFGILAGFLYVGLGLNPRELQSPLVGKIFPRVIVEDFFTAENEGVTERIEENVSIVNVWASWCETCKAEHEVLMAGAKQYEGVQMVGVNYKDKRRAGENFLKAYGNPYDWVIFDPKGSLGMELGVYATPETFVVGIDGYIKLKHTGMLTVDIWKNEIQPIVEVLLEEQRKAELD